MTVSLRVPGRKKDRSSSIFFKPEGHRDHIWLAMRKQEISKTKEEPPHTIKTVIARFGSHPECHGDCNDQRNDNGEEDVEVGA